jgi:hypothetical protein
VAGPKRYQALRFHDADSLAAAERQVREALAHCGFFTEPTLSKHF